MLGAVIGIHLSLALGAAAVVATAIGLLVWESKTLRAGRPI
jgi:hypothetical protein